jgi:hypothetical protein
VWTPLVVGATALLGRSFTALAERTVGTGWIAWFLIAVAVVAVMQVAILALTNRRGLAIRCARAVRFEFWPNWAIYGPLLPFAAWRSMRFGFARTLTAVNPCWPDSGVIGESKQAGLDAFDPEFVSPSFRVSPGADGRFVWAKARIEGAKVVVEADGVTDPVEVVYAWQNNPVRANLVNGVGLPAVPFRSKVAK